MTGVEACPTSRPRLGRPLHLAVLLATLGVIAACTQTAPSVPTWTVVAHVKVGQTPGPITLGGRWAFVPNMSDGTVTQIDRGSGKVVATISVADPHVLRAQGCAPDSVHAYYSGSWGWRMCDTPYAMAWDGSSLWALDNGRTRLVRVDPVLHRTSDEISLPGTGWAVAIGGTTAWVSGFAADHSLYRVDLRTPHAVTTITDLDQGPASLAVDPSGVWVACVRAGTGHLDRIDPATGQVAGRYTIEWWSSAVVASSGALYVRGTFGGDISRVNTATGAVEWSQPGPGFIGRQGIDELGAAPDGIWMSGPTTARIDPATGRIAETLRVISSSAAADLNELWLVQIDGSVAEFKKK
jgi:DNA-binding beta-propeller fold protein YncE